MPRFGRLVARAQLVLAMGLLSGSCAPRPPARVDHNIEPQRAMLPYDDERSLFEHVPADTRRCVMARPADLARDERALMQPLSQANPIAWQLLMDVTLYLRAERDGAAGTSEQLEYFHFASSDAAAIRQALQASDTRALHWPDEPTPCADSACEPVEARFLDARTVLLRATLHTRSDRRLSASCRALRSMHPRAVEVASWGSDALTRNRLESTAALYVEKGWVTRVLMHRFVDERTAERALERALSGEDDAPMLGSSLAQRTIHRSHEWLEQRSKVSIEELTLAARERAEQAALAPPTPPPHVETAVDTEALAQLEQLTARLCKRAQRRGRAAVHPAASLPLAEIPRLFAYWARLLAEREQAELGVHIVARVASMPPVGDPAPALRSGACGDEAYVLAATTSDDAQLREQGVRLSKAVGDGELQLLIGLRPLTGERHGDMTSVRLIGRVDQGAFTVREVSRKLRAARWPLVERHLVAPLSTLQGALFPPEEWVMETRSAHEALNVLAAAQNETGAACDHQDTWVRCKGSFADPRAAARSLRRAAAVVLLREARLLWSE